MIMDTVIVKRVMQNIIVRYVYDNAWNVPMPKKKKLPFLAWPKLQKLSVSLLLLRAMKLTNNVIQGL